jgi:hypothetical protein
VEDASSGSTAASEPRTTRVNVMFRRFTAQFYLGRSWRRRRRKGRYARGVRTHMCHDDQPVRRGIADRTNDVIRRVFGPVQLHGLGGGSHLRPSRGTGWTVLRCGGQLAFDLLNQRGNFGSSRILLRRHQVTERPLSVAKTHCRRRTKRGCHAAIIVASEVAQVGTRERCVTGAVVFYFDRAPSNASPDVSFSKDSGIERIRRGYRMDHSA